MNDIAVADRETNNLAIHDARIVLMLACKAGNTSLKQALHDAGYATDDPRGRYFGFEHWTAEECALNDYYRIAILRHPAARLISTWYAKVSKMGRARVIGEIKVDMLERHSEDIYLDMPLAEFIRAVHSIPDTAADPHIRSQCFDRFYQGLYLPKKVFKLEAPTENWWPRLREYLPLLPAKMPHVNISGAPDWREVCSEDDLRLISIRYQADLWLGGYLLR